MKSSRGIHLFRFVSSVGRAPLLHGEGQGFKSLTNHAKHPFAGCCVSLAQIVERLPEEQEVASASLAGDT